MQDYEKTYVLVEFFFKSLNRKRTSFFLGLTSAHIHVYGSSDVFMYNATCSDHTYK